MTSSPMAPRSRKTPLEAAIASPITCTWLLHCPSQTAPSLHSGIPSAPFRIQTGSMRENSFPKVQSVERIHGKDGLRQVHASNPRRGGDSVKERAGGIGRSACASCSASLKAPDFDLVLLALRACSARSTTVKCSTLLYLSGGPVLTCPPFTGRRCLSGRPQATDLAISSYRSSVVTYASVIRPVDGLQCDVASIRNPPDAMATRGAL